MKPKREGRRRKRELFLIGLLGSLFAFLVWFEFRIFLSSNEASLLDSVTFFGLVNFNLCLLLILFFLTFRNLFKAFVERRKGVAGSSLKSRLIVTFFLFSSVPTLLMFFVSFYYINSSFDKWFSEHITSVLKNSLEVSQLYYKDAKKQNFHAAHQIITKIEAYGDSVPEKVLQAELEKFRLDGLEYYKSASERAFVTAKDETLPAIPFLDESFLEKGLAQKVEASQVEELEAGNIIRTMVPNKAGNAVLVANRYIPFSLLKKIDSIGLTYEELKGQGLPLLFTLRSLSILSLLLMTAVILFCSTWFGLYMARHLSRALSTLSDATTRISKGDYRSVEIANGETEVMELAENFNSMASQLEKSQSDLTRVNKSLQKTLHRLDERSKYVEVILSNVSTGVISTDTEDMITTINDRCESLFKISSQDYLKKNLQDVVGDSYYRFYRKMVTNMSQYNITKMSRQLDIELNGIHFPCLFTISRITNEHGVDTGRVIGFDDLTDVLKSQKIEAWREVAKRIAHEIKNPLTPIKLSAQRLQKKFGGSITDEAFKQCTDMIVQQTDEMKKLVNEFSDYARMPMAEKSMNDINRLLSETIPLYQTAFKEKTFKMNLVPEVPQCLFDYEQIKRVVINLIENAVTATNSVAEGKVLVSSNFDEKRKVIRFSISDNGEGSGDKDLKKLFDPYYSTKQEKSGLGLAIVNKIIEDHEGLITACENSWGGLEFNVELPLRTDKET